MYVHARYTSSTVNLSQSYPLGQYTIPLTSFDHQINRLSHISFHYYASIRYLSHLIGHESGGSILSALKAKGWANGLGAMTYHSYSFFSCFCANVELTDDGVNHIDDIISCIFAYIGELTTSFVTCCSRNAACEYKRCVVWCDVFVIISETYAHNREYSINWRLP
jgi:hypothetical protein